ncbi:unnamed protein product [Heligmosomoides polygyrus]|uniref:Succ_DH_flav_C domain-containing protein n=1 Tax=Heligmosomoides polygyrus TaxID=6339 RepID=A0A183GV18_HELPZ|nr:unnamed protein product [Heligmosomoides polygyrus]
MWRQPKPRFWLTLGDTDEEREAAFEKRKKARARWTILVRGAFSEHCTYDIRKYVLDANGRLVPAPKVKIVRVGPEPKTSQRTPEDDNEGDDDAA